MQTGTYTLNLLCDAIPWHEHALGYATPNPMGEYVGDYPGEFGSKCRAQARKAGWILHRDGRAMCPECNPKRKKPKRSET